MPIVTHWSPAEGCLTLEVVGRFDASLHFEFRAAWERFEPRPTRFVVDLAHTESIDASALGLLFLLRQRALRTRASVAIVHAPPRVARALEAVRFARWFAAA